MSGNVEPGTTGIQLVRLPRERVASACSATWCCHVSAVPEMGGNCQLKMNLQS